MRQIKRERERERESVSESEIDEIESDIESGNEIVRD